MKTLSFIIPAYNSQSFLERCVSSMLVPEILDCLEIIIVNDGSTDATAQIAESFCRRWPNVVRLISQENRGHGGAVNTGCAAASGKYLKVIDADDWVEQQNLPAFLSLLDSCDSDVILTHYHTVDMGTGEVKDLRTFPRAFGVHCPFREIVENWSSFEWGLTFHGITYRTDFYRANAAPLPEHVYYEDHAFAAFPCCRAKSLMCFDLFVYDYRVGDVNQSVSDANQLRRIGQLEAIFRHMASACQALPAGDGKRYAALKTEGVLMSYLSTALLVNPDRKDGRRQAQSVMALCRRDYPEMECLVRGKYAVFSLLNRLGIRKKDWNRILNSGIYQRLRKKQPFQISKNHAER